MISFGDNNPYKVISLGNTVNSFYVLIAKGDSVHS